jgi:hypothetical protein
MSKGYQLFFAGTLGSLALLAVGAGTYSTGIWIDSPSSYPKYRETPKEAQDRIPSLSFEQAINSAKQNQPCSKPEGYNQSYLCAQWRSTDAAERASRWAWFQMAFSFFGIIGLVTTLYFNFEAWRQASNSQAATNRALREAERSAAAAERQANIAETALLSLERPYIFPALDEAQTIRSLNQSHHMHGSEALNPIIPTVYFSVENYGRVPGIIVTVICKFTRSSEPPDTFAMRHPLTGRKSGLTLRQNGSENYEIPFDLPVDAGVTHELVSGVLPPLWFSGRITYRDAGGELSDFHHTNFCWRFRQNEVGWPAHFSQFGLDEFNRST